MGKFGKYKNLAEMVKATVEQISGLKPDTTVPDSSEISQNIRTMRIQLIENQKENDEQPVLWFEIFKSDFLHKIIQLFSHFEFEGKKDARLLFVHCLQKKMGSKFPTVQYVQSRPDILHVLCDLYLSPGDGLHAGPMLRECINYSELAEIFIHAEYFYDLFKYSELPTFDIASDAFATLRVSLTKHKKLASKFLEENYEKFFTVYELMLASQNYATRRQYLKLLSDLLLDRSNFAVMAEYILNPHYLKTMMVLLKDSSPSIQFEAFHVFKILVANPKKPDAIVDILTRNKSRLIRLLENFLPERDNDEQFIQEKEYLLNQIKEM